MSFKFPLLLYQSSNDGSQRSGGERVNNHRVVGREEEEGPLWSCVGISTTIGGLNNMNHFHIAAAVAYNAKT